MLKMRQSLNVPDVTTVVFFDVFYRDLGREASIPKVRAWTELSDSAFGDQSRQIEDVTSELLSDRCAGWLRWFETEIAKRYEATGGGLEIIADVLQRGFDDPSCSGFAFLNLAAGIDSINEDPFAEAEEQKEHLRHFLELLASRMGLQHSDIAAAAAVHVIEQTIGWAREPGRPKETDTARLLLQCLQHS